MNEIRKSFCQIRTNLKYSERRHRVTETVILDPLYYIRSFDRDEKTTRFETPRGLEQNSWPTCSDLVVDLVIYRRANLRLILAMSDIKPRNIAWFWPLWFWPLGFWPLGYRCVNRSRNLEVRNRTETMIQRKKNLVFPNLGLMWKKSWFLYLLSGDGCVNVFAWTSPSFVMKTSEVFTTRKQTILSSRTTSNVFRAWNTDSIPCCFIFL